jgi:putative NADH-flavin reductase
MLQAPTVTPGVLVVQNARPLPLLSLGLAFILVVATPSFTQAAAPAAHKPLSIVLVGASGMIGSRILAEASSRGHHVLAASRHPEKIAQGPNITPVKLDATDKKAFSLVARKADVIVMATSPRGGGDPVTEERAVADAAIMAAHTTGARLVVVGGAGSLNLPDGKPLVDTLPPAYQGEARAMRAVLDSLKTMSDIDWTFVSPPFSIAPGTRTGHFQLGSTVLLKDDKGQSRISAEDFAVALVDELESPAHRRAQMTVAY